MKKAMKNGGLFLLLTALTFYIIGRKLDPVRTVEALAEAEKVWLLAAVTAVALFLICEGVNISRLLRALQCQAGFREGLRYVCIGFFFSAVTPSASGGQPMQLYAMHRRGVDFSKGMASLLSEYLSFQLVSAVLATLGFLYQRHIIAETLGNSKYLLLAGMVISIALATFLLVVLLWPAASAVLIRLAVRIVSAFSRSWGERTEHFLNSQLADFLCSAKKMRRDSSLIIKTIVTTLIQLTAIYSVTYLVYRSLGFNSGGFLQVTALQAVLSVSVSVLPLPGAVGISESCFLLLFAALPGGGQDIGSLMLLSRICSFYLPVVFTGLISTILTHRKL